MTGEAQPGYGTVEHSAELSRRLASERLKTETLERTRDEWKKRAEESEKMEAEMLAEVDKALVGARDKLERFLRALQSIASEPCASRLVSARVCDLGFLCASCKAKQAIRESETPERRES